MPPTSSAIAGNSNAGLVAAAAAHDQQQQQQPLLTYLDHFTAGHEDLVHDVAYDYYGKRLATCSSDHRIRVWDLHEAAPPEGSVAGALPSVATGVGAGVSSHQTGEDSARTGRSQANAPPNGTRWVLNDSWQAHDASVVKIAWAHPEFGQVLASCSFDRSVRIWEENESESRQTGKRWTQRIQLLDSRWSVQDIEFSPRHLGLRLDRKHGKKFFLWKLENGKSKATTASDGVVRIYEAMDVMNLAHWPLMDQFEASNTAGMKELETNFCLSWCPSRFQEPMIVVGCGRENCAKIWKQQDRKWVAVETLSGHEGVVHDVAWAPVMGRSYQLIATACKDKCIRIYKVFTTDRVRAELAFKSDEHGAEAWRVEWNLTGTILCSSGDDGKVRLWKANPNSDQWQVILVLDSKDDTRENVLSQ